MYAAISGLKAHMNKLNVIGNNIANVNTDGFKAGRAFFEDALYTTSKSGSNGSTVAGSINPSQIGYGVNVGSIDLDMSKGNYKPTGIDSDIYIDGEGFFMLGDKTTGDGIDPSNPESLKRFTLSRVGHLEWKADNYLTDGNGNVVYGFLCTGYDTATQKYTFSDQLVPLHMPRQETVTVPADPNDPNSTETTKIEIRYPTDGENHDQKLTDARPENTDPTAGATEYPYVRIDTISVDRATGLITGVTKDSSDPIVIGYLALANVTNPNGLTHISGSYFQASAGAGDVTVCMMGNAGEGAGIQYVNGSLFGDANGGGADTNPPELMRVGGNGSGQFIPGGLEQSKTDLANEIAEMITTQRGYQANTRIITVTDSMLEELVNIKR